MFYFDGQLLMDLKTLLEDWSETVCEEGECKTHILTQSFLCLGVCTLWNISVEDEVEGILVDTDLVCDHISLIVKEVLQ